MAKDDRAEFLEKLSKAGVEFSVPLVDGFYILKPKEVLEYLDAPDLFAAKRRGVTLEHWQAWKKFVENPHCYATTRKGKPCRNVTRLAGLEEFTIGLSEYCHTHQEHT
jgi:hypothetical protein